MYKTPEMKKAKVFVKGIEAGILTELIQDKEYVFEYHDDYKGLEVSRTMPVKLKVCKYDKFPPFFEGLLKIRKIDPSDYFSQLMAVGDDMVGAVTVKEIAE